MCVGAGLDMISACDLRLCTQDATFTLREARIGIVADMGVLQRLPHIIGQMYTRQMAYTGRFFSAPEVERMGLVLEVYGISLAVHKNMLLLTSGDCMEAMVAFSEKRKPNFKGA